MKAVLLAAGPGSRLGRLTETTPKCLLPLAGSGTLVRNVEWLASLGVRDLAVNLHHRHELVTGLLGDGRGLGVRIRYSFEPELRGTAGALVPLAAWLGEEPFLVVYADNLLRCDLEALDRRHRDAGAAVTVALSRRANVSESGVAVLDGQGLVADFVEKPAPGDVPSRLVSAGLLLCEPSVLELVPAGRPSDIGRDLLPALLAAGRRVAGYRLGPGESLRWIDTPADLARTEAWLRAQEAAA